MFYHCLNKKKKKKKHHIMFTIDKICVISEQNVKKTNTGIPK